MRHQNHHRKLGRTSEHRLSLRRSLAQSLFEHGQITTTISKAKDVRPFAEKLITLAKRAHAGSFPARQRLLRMMNDRSVIPADHQGDYNMMSDASRQKTLRSRAGRRYRTGQARAGMKFTGQSVLHRLIDTVAPRFADRPGGYTRIIRLPDRRIGDNGELAVLQLIGEEEAPGPVSKPKKTLRQKRVERRYAAAARALKGTGGRPAASTRGAKAADNPAEESPAPENTPDATDTSTPGSEQGAS